jgi:F0F1-type ATP synthase membrane subunit b/b'
LVLNNTNISRANIINLAAVIAIVISFFVGGNFGLFLEDRRKTILNA